MGVAASSAHGGLSSGSGSDGGGGPGLGGERDRDRASSSLRHTTEASPHDSLAGGMSTVVSSMAPGSHASLPAGRSSGWGHASGRYDSSDEYRRRLSAGSHAGARPASDDGGATSVQVKIMPLVQGKGEVKSFKVTSMGGVLQGGMAPEVRDIARDYEKLTGQALPRFFVEDRRAQQLLITHVGEDYFVVPSPELFSRHTGTCRVLGDKHQRAADYALQIGDYLRIGSVGLVVSEMHTGREGAGAVAIAERDLYYLREDVNAIKDDLFEVEEAPSAAAEQGGRLSPGKSPRVAQCYMCFDDEDSTENPLVAPCLCKGGTRYVHLSCLQKWQASAADDKLENCVATSAERKSACKVCKSRYKTHVRTSDGRLLPLMVHQLPPPFICFLVVTKHETAEELFNTQFQLSFTENKQIVIGRSRNCNMVLDYRTVSTQHATVTFRKGQFFFRDLSSSNGSMLNLRQPLKLPYNQWVRLRYGRSIVALKAKRSWMRRKLSSMSSTLAGAAAAATGGGVMTTTQQQQQQQQQQQEAGGAGSRESWGGGQRGTVRMSVSQHLSLDMLLQQHQQQQQQQQQQQRPARQVGDSSSSASAASSAASSSDATPGSSTSPVNGVGAGGGGASSHSRGSSHGDGKGDGQLDLLDSLCRIDATPRPRSGLGASGLLTPGGGRFYQSIAGESMSPGAVSAALFQLHLQAASSRRVFGGEGGEGEEGGQGGAGGAAAVDESVYEDAAEHADHSSSGQPRKPRPASLAGTAEVEAEVEGEPAAGGQQQPRQVFQFHRVQFVPADSPGDSQLSELGR